MNVSLIDQALELQHSREALHQLLLYEWFTYLNLVNNFPEFGYDLEFCMVHAI
jgi:hypothetical protein